MENELILLLHCTTILPYCTQRKLVHFCNGSGAVPTWSSGKQLSRGQDSNQVGPHRHLAGQAAWGEEEQCTFSKPGSSSMTLIQEVIAMAW